MARQVDLLVIGAGPVAAVEATRGPQRGASARRDKKPNRLGGECLNYGCIPSKALIFTANLVHKLRHAGEMGIEYSGLRVNTVKLQEWRRSVIERLNRGIEQLCKVNGVEILYGEASFLDPHRVRVKGGMEEEVVAGKVIVATGSQPIDLPAFRFDRTTILSSKEALELSATPRALLVIGGGITGLELGTYFAKLGTKVTVIELLDQVLPGMDAEVARIVTRSLKKLGVDVYVRSKATSWSAKDGRLLIKAETPEGAREIVADKVLVTVGRKPNTTGLNL